MSKFFTPAEVAERYNIKVTTVWKWLREGKLHAIQFGRDYRISEEDLQKFEQERKTKNDGN